jgi:hypothetical protein
MPELVSEQDQLRAGCGAEQEDQFLPPARARWLGRQVSLWSSQPHTWCCSYGEPDKIYPPRLATHPSLQTLGTDNQRVAKGK